MNLKISLIDNYIMEIDLSCDSYVTVHDLKKDLNNAVSFVKGVC